MSLRLFLVRRRRDRDQRATRFENPIGLGLRFSTHSIQNNIYVVQYSRKVGGPIINHLICTEASDQFSIGSRRSCDHAGSEVFGKLDGEASDTPCAGMHKDRLPSFKACSFEKSLPRGSSSCRQAGAFSQTNFCGSCRKVPCRDHRKFGERTTTTILRSVTRSRL